MASPRQEKDKKRRRPGGEGGVIEEVGTGIEEGVVDCRIDEGKVQGQFCRLSSSEFSWGLRSDDVVCGC
jgi:hypothetical protein